MTLIEKISNAFSTVSYPGNEHLTNSFGEEAEALIKDFSGKTDWAILTPDFLDQAPDGWCSALSFFSGKALQFDLPAYLIADLRGLLLYADPPSRLCTFVTPQMENRRIAKIYGGGTLGGSARQDFGLLDARQVSAIVVYLWWRLEQESCNLTIEQALENYWLEREETLNNMLKQSFNLKTSVDR